MKTSTFTDNISKINFSFKKTNEEGGVRLTNNYTQLNNKISPQELFALETAKEKFAVDAVYFRHFDDGRGATPQIYIYDNTQELLTDKDKRDIYVKVWSGCQVPMFIIIGKTEAKVFDAREKLKDDIDNYAFDTITLIGESISKFNEASFDDGLFWEEEKSKNNFQLSTSAYETLIGELQFAYKELQKITQLDSHIILKLLVQCLLIKYLEERDDKQGYLSTKYFKAKFKCNNFCEVIRQGELLNLLDILAADFNGKIFEWHADEEAISRAAIKDNSLKALADCLDGNLIQGKQMVIWRQYSFTSLPVELISSVYENLLTNSKDIVYTPEMVASTLVDECMPLTTPQKDYKVIDVSCGSGIFLVKAYKRIIQWWRFEQWQETGELKKPSLPQLKQLLTDSIYGVDIDNDAIRLTVFSLALAMLDEVDLSPPNWQKLKFANLIGENIFCKNFFGYISNNPPNDFDLVIGNPPFNLRKVNGKEPKKEEYFKEMFEEYGYKNEIKIPDNNIALHFLTQVPKLLKQDAMLCLIQPSGPLLYQKDVAFKQTIFSNLNLLQVIDFTKLDDVLWGKAKVATAAVFFKNCPPTNENVVHIIANRSFANVHKLFLEFDHYDFHSITNEDALNNANIWKANLIGGGRLSALIDRLTGLRTLGEYLTIKENEGWANGEGFIASEKGKPCDYIFNKLYIPTKSFTEEGINWSKSHKCLVEKIHRPTNKKIYTSPHILLKANLGREKLLTYYSNEYVVFKDKIIGIHSPKKDEQQLITLYNFLNDNPNLLRFHIISTSGQVAVNRATAIIKDDLMNLPYPENFKDIKTSTAENILINDVLKYQLNNGEKLLAKKAIEPQIKAFAKSFCQTLNSVYKVDGKAFSLFKILDAGNYYALHFEYSSQSYNANPEKIDSLSEYIENIIPPNKKRNKSHHIQRILKVYGKDTIILAKPKQLRYWIQSIAFRDADETFADYIKARYY